MSTPIALISGGAAVPSWLQSQPSPPPATPAIQPVTGAEASGSSADSSTDAGQPRGGAIYTPQAKSEGPQLYTRPPAQGTIHPEQDSGTAAADVAKVNAAPEPGEAKRSAPAQAAASAAYAMVADSPGTMPSSVLHPLRDA